MKNHISIKRVLSWILASALSFIMIVTMYMPIPATTITDEITISCFESDRYKDFLENAAKAFEARYPGLKVNIDAFSAMPLVTSIYTDGVETGRRIDDSIDPKAKSDYISRVNTEIMSGDGADIYAIDVLPYYSPH